MSDMIERVAKALAVSDSSDTLWRYYIPDARAAIEAMRQPTEAMTKAASIEAQKPTGWHSVYPNIWKAMIDAALAAQEPSS